MIVERKTPKSRTGGEHFSADCARRETGLGGPAGHGLGLQARKYYVAACFSVRCGPRPLRYGAFDLTTRLPFRIW